MELNRCSSKKKGLIIQPFPSSFLPLRLHAHTQSLHLLSPLSSPRLPLKGILNLIINPACCLYRCRPPGIPLLHYSVTFL